MKDTSITFGAVGRDILSLVGAIELCIFSLPDAIARVGVSKETV